MSASLLQVTGVKRRDMLSTCRHRRKYGGIGENAVSMCCIHIAAKRPLVNGPCANVVVALGVSAGLRRYACGEVAAACCHVWRDV